MIEVRNLTKKYGDKTVVDNVCLLYTSDAADETYPV